MQIVSGYKLLGSDQRGQLESSVNQAITDGWVPSGPIIQSGSELIQAMVMFDEAHRA